MLHAILSVNNEVCNEIIYMLLCKWSLHVHIDTRFARQIFLRWPRSLVALHNNPTYSLPEIPPLPL